MYRIGFVVNPIAGMGGRVGLKGTDSVEEAIRRGAVPVAPKRAEEFCNGIDAHIFTCSSSMGADYIDGEIVYKAGKSTTAEDTKKACKEFLKRGVDLIIFVGGDGTACDVYNIVGKKVAILGIPSGVKMYSGVFALNPKAGREILKAFLNEKAEIVEREIMDIDEEAYRNDVLKIKIYGSAFCPSIKYFLQNGKRIFGENDSKKEIAIFFSLICRKGTYVLGPGSTIKAIADELDVEKTLLGVDVIEDGELIIKDANEKEILKAIEGKKARIIVSPLGRQGFIFGRGNQQISSKVIKKIGVKNVIIVSTPQKILHTKELFVDTGDDELNRKLEGWKQVIVGFGVAVRKKIIF